MAITMRDLLQKILPIDVDLSKHNIRLKGDTYFKDRTSYKQGRWTKISKVDHELLAYGSIGGVGIAAYKRKNVRKCGAFSVGIGGHEILSLLKAESEGTQANVFFEINKIEISEFGKLMSSVDFLETDYPEGTDERLNITATSYVDSLPVVARFLSVDETEQKRGFYGYSKEKCYIVTRTQFRLFKNGNLRIEGGRKNKKIWWHKNDHELAEDCIKEAAKAVEQNEDILRIASFQSKYYYSLPLKQVALKEAVEEMAEAKLATHFFEQYPGNLSKEEVWEKFELQNVVSEL